MVDEDGGRRALEVIIAEKVLTRIKNQLLIIFIGTFVVTVVIAASLVWEHRTLSDLSQSRISEYRLLVAEKLDELHQLDREEVSRRTRSVADCEAPLPYEDAEALLTEELGRPPESEETQQILEKAAGFGVCDIGVVQHILEDAENMARVDTVYRILLHRPADPLGRFIYGYWLASGVGVEAVARDIMVSPEFLRLRKLSGP